MHIKNRHNKNKGVEMARYRPPAKMINTWTKLVESLVTSRGGWVGVMDVMVQREKKCWMELGRLPRYGGCHDATKATKESNQNF